MRISMPESPLVRSLFDYAYWKRLKEGLSESDYEEFVRRWNSRRTTGAQGSHRSSESSSE